MTRNYVGYRPLRDNSHRQMTAPLRTFSVHVAGETNNAHQAFVRHLKGIDQVETQFLEESDYLLVFCPVSSRVGTDISEALERLGNIPDDKKIILVVMHHTFDRDHVVAPSSTQVTKPNVILTVDSLFYEGNFLNSTRNEIAWEEVQKALGIQPSKYTSWQPSGNKIFNFLRKYRVLVATGLLVCVGIIVVVTLTLEKKNN